jgi:hypothetical protein
MHERTRAADPDFAHVEFAIFQFTRSARGPRTPILFYDISVERFSFDDLDEMVRETYHLWREISEERFADLRRRKAGGIGGGFL